MIAWAIPTLAGAALAFVVGGIWYGALFAVSRASRRSSDPASTTRKPTEMPEPVKLSIPVLPSCRPGLPESRAPVAERSTTRTAPPAFDPEIVAARSTG